MDSRRSIISWLGIPEAFGTVILSLALILTLAPYLAGTDFGIFKVPDLNAQYRKILKWLGPVSLLGAFLLFVPLLETATPPAVLSPLTPGYDFIAKASIAKWSNGSSQLSFPGNRDDSRGFVYFGSYEVLADDTVSPRFLEMHPEWTYHGFIEGKYGPFQIANDLKFHGQVGFLKTASGSDGVNFKIEYLPLSSIDRDRQILKEKHISFDPKNPKIQPLSDNSDNSVDLSLLNNSKGYIILSVHAGENSGRDHAVWVEARVTR
ncbi:MAG TPA: hypothetical protein DCY88_06605 [Cyanobacteria bacterium UBA11372]|nr:hypothetical protein [Cyanobacteria bacterium UBA11372]